MDMSPNGMGLSVTHEFRLGLSVPNTGRASRALNGVCEPVQQDFRFLESKTCIGDALTIRYGCILTSSDKVALEHQRSNGRNFQVPHDRVRHVDLPRRIFLAVAVAAVHHEDLGKLGRAKESNRAFDGGSIEVGSGLTTTTEHKVSVGIAGGFQDGRCAFLGKRWEQVSAARSLYRVHGHLNVTVCAVLDAHRHRQTRRQLSVYLALRGAGSDRTPADEVGIELAKGRIEKLGPGGDPQLQNIGEQLPSQA